MQELYKRIEQHEPFDDLNIECMTSKELERSVEILLEEIRKDILDASADRFKPTWCSGKDCNLSMRDQGRLKKYEYIVGFFISNLSKDVNLRIVHTINKGPCYWGYEDTSNLLSGDTLHIPYIGRFSKRKYYYKTIFHELAHACCSIDRLKTKMSNEEEEICVECVALYLSLLLGLNVWDDCRKYILEWSYGERNKEGQPVGRPLFKTKTEFRRIKTSMMKIIRLLFTGNKKQRGSISFII